MSYTPPDFQNLPNISTPLEAAALIDAFTDLAAYAESLAGGIELGYAEITADATRASTTPADVAGLSTTVTVAARPIIVTFGAGAVTNGSASGGAIAYLLEDGSKIGSAFTFDTAAATVFPVHRQVRRSPAAGSHTYKIQLATFVTGTATIKADSGATYGPASIGVYQV